MGNQSGELSYTVGGVRWQERVGRGVLEWGSSVYKWKEVWGLSGVEERGVMGPASMGC